MIERVTHPIEGTLRGLLVNSIGHATQRKHGEWFIADRPKSSVAASGGLSENIFAAAEGLAVIDGCYGYGEIWDKNGALLRTSLHFIDTISYSRF